MATNKNFEVKNGLSVAGTERISAAGVFAGSLSGSLASATTATTQSVGDSSTKIATTAYTDAAITAVIGGAPGTLNTLNELAAAIGDDASYASTLTTALATKLPLAGGTLTGNVTATRVYVNGGTVYGLGVQQLASARFDTVDSGNNSDPLELVYYSGTGVIIGAPGSAKYLSVLGDIRMGSTSVIDASRNLTNIGLITSSHFNTSANVNSSGAGGAAIPSGKRLGFDQSGTRSWTQYAAGGNLLFASGDGAGAVQANNFTGVTLTVSGKIEQGTGQSHYFRGNDANWRMGSDIVSDSGGLISGASTQMIVGGSGDSYGFQIFGHQTSTSPCFEVIPNSSVAASKTNIRGNLYVANTLVIDSSRNVTAENFTTTAGGVFTTASGNDLNIVYPDSRSLFIKEGSATHLHINNVGDVSIGGSASSGGSGSRWLSLDANSGNGYTGGLLYKIGGAIKAYHYVENNYIMHQTTASVGQKFYAGTTVAMTLDAGTGALNANQAVIQGGSATRAGIANPPAGYLGANGADYGTTAIYRTPTVESTSSSTTTSQFLTIYSSGHWGEYPVFRFKVYGTYYVGGYREYLGFMTSTAASLVEVQTNGTTSFFGGGGNNTITMGAAVGSGLASHGGQARYRRDFSVTTFGNYGRCHVVVEIMFGGNRYFGSNTTTSNLDADGATGGCYHFKTMSAAQGQGTFSST